MTLLEQIKQDSISARKVKSDVAVFLTTLLGEAQRPGKDLGNRMSTDEEVIKVVKKFQAGLEENAKIFQVRNDVEKLERVLKEQEVLKKYLPKQMSEEELTSYIKEAMELKGFSSIKEIMPYLKNSINGLYDGAMASKIIKQLCES